MRVRMNWTAIIENPKTNDIQVIEFQGPHGAPDASKYYQETLENDKQVLRALVPGSHKSGSLVVNKSSQER